MTKYSLALVISLAAGFSAQSLADDIPDGYQLQQVLIMSRHNLRAPLANNGSVLEQSTRHAWPQWDVPGGHLTTKGGVLEVYMGHYMREWLEQQKLLTPGECPAASRVYAYANSLQRTVATAQFFVTGAFPGCDVPVHHQPQMGTMDPTFNPVITNDDPQFSARAVSAMAQQRQRDQLDDSYQLLAQIVDYKNSPACTVHQQCDLAHGKDTFSARLNEEPGVSGPLKVGNSLVDAFTLQYYEGFPIADVAWGNIRSEQQWRVLSALKNSYQDSLFTSPAVARNVAAPLIRYLNQALVKEAGKGPAVTLLVGHDSNIASLLSALEVENYQLPGQFERTPIGGKILFERWHNAKNNQDNIKLEYVYQSTQQLRDGAPLNLAHPAQRVTLSLKGCPVDSHGFCPAEQFARLLGRDQN
ncbi:bifunctional glucose-1-phosphatase/inositol phosphatase [Shimwellia pseudoproteus]|uniref:bifunctional glucose-1-phosphatase/inositol phosphatase n=1 Tax=Shimwellia pseudoproteus TaxID=570012 RepID=UPI0018ED7DCA|nr:bifunctional glucose-1-phosphatase/inositol phosphatase [Shimwellia pseudoproteus]MBJ3815950.1 bifunctional glucose-1-phosphatase/inositol phosphatase [Shimwellia pseudoproteus]